MTEQKHWTWATLPSAVLERRATEGGKPAVSYRAAGDRFLLVEYGESVFDLSLNFFVHSVIGFLAEHPISGVIETSPGFRSIVFSLSPKLTARDLVRELDHVNDNIAPLAELVLPSRIVHLPASIDDSVSRQAVERYAKSIRPDAVNCEGGNNVDYTLAYNGLADRDELTEHITSTDLWVGFVGFFPGLPFMFPLDPRHVLFAPKYNPTRTWTQEGAIGLGGPCYSIYPVESPGGYQLLGRTLPVYDMKQRNRAFRESPILLRPSDRVRFHSVPEQEILDGFEAVHADRYEYVIEDSEINVGQYLDWNTSLDAESSAFAERRDAAAAVTPVP